MPWGLENKKHFLLSPQPSRLLQFNGVQAAPVSYQSNSHEENMSEIAELGFDSVKEATRRTSLAWTLPYRAIAVLGRPTSQSPCIATQSCRSFKLITGHATSRPVNGQLPIRRAVLGRPLQSAGPDGPDSPHASRCTAVPREQRTTPVRTMARPDPSDRADGRPACATPPRYFYAGGRARGVAGEGR